MNRTARTFYTEYVLHAARFYARNLHLRGKMDFKSGADMLNWNACIKTLALFDKCDQEILLEVFRSREPLAESVSAAAVKRVAGVSLLEEFGAAEAVWHFDVVDFRGVVAMDAHGNSLFDEVRISSERKMKGLMK